MPAFRHKDSKSADGRFCFALSQVIKPDEAKGEYPVDVLRIGRTTDGRAGACTLAQEGARICGRQAVLQVRFGTQFGDSPARKLPEQ